MNPTAKYKKRRYVKRALKSAGLNTLLQVIGKMKTVRVQVVMTYGLN